MTSDNLRMDEIVGESGSRGEPGCKTTAISIVAAATVLFFVAILAVVAIV